MAARPCRAPISVTLECIYNDAKDLGNYLGALTGQSQERDVLYAKRFLNDGNTCDSIDKLLSSVAYKV